MPFLTDKEAGNAERERSPALVVRELESAVRAAMRAQQFVHIGELPAEMMGDGKSLEEHDALVDALVFEARQLGVQDDPVIQRIFTDVRAEF